MSQRTTAGKNQGSLLSHAGCILLQVLSPWLGLLSHQPDHPLQLFLLHLRRSQTPTLLMTFITSSTKVKESLAFVRFASKCLLFLTIASRLMEPVRPGCANRREYSEGTSTSGLRVHLETFHLDEYLRVCREKGWGNQLPSHKKSQAASTSTSAAAQFRMPFSAKAFLEHLVNFIVADDQVSSHYLFLPRSNISCSLSMSLNAPNSANSFCFCDRTSKIKTFPAERKFERPSLMRGWRILMS
jgi:hypothetical protein